MAVECQGVSPLPSPWGWDQMEGPFARAAGPVSPTIRGQAINENGSFLQSMQSFRLSGEDEPQSPLRVDSSNMSAPPLAIPIYVPPAQAPASTHRQPHHADDDAMEHFDERSMRPSMEEQAWLDQEYENLMDSDEPFSESSLAEEEDEYVRRLLALHPGVLDEEEARWLWQRERHQRELAGGPG